MRSLPILALAAVMIAPVAAAAGSYTVQNIDGGTEPNTFRVQITIDSDLEGQCPDYTCGWCCTGHAVTIEPAPVATQPDLIASNPQQPLLYGLDMSDPGGDGTFWVDLDVSVTYTFSGARTWALWHPLGIDGCDPSQECYRTDDTFPTVEVAGPAVPSGRSGWSAIKVRYRASGPAGSAPRS